MCLFVDIVESITPTKVQGIRSLINGSGLDILYYTSPRYKPEVTMTVLRTAHILYYTSPRYKPEVTMAVLRTAHILYYKHDKSPRCHKPEVTMTVLRAADILYGTQSHCIWMLDCLCK